jgi:hypothetical protein
MQATSTNPSLEKRMSINVYDHIASIQRGPICYRFEAAYEEDLDPREHFDNDEEIIEQIELGELEWFRVRCQAIVADAVLASSYLGGCCYQTLADFMEDDYVEDMIEDTRRIATNKLLELSEAFQELRAKG